LQPQYPDDGVTAVAHVDEEGLDGLDALANAAATTSTYAAQSSKSTAASAPGKKPDQRIVKNRDGVRLINLLVKFKLKFLARDQCLTRPEKDAKMRNVFWEFVATEFNKTDVVDPEVDCFYAGYEDRDWFGLGLGLSRTGFIMTAEKAKAMFNEMRADHMKKQADFRKSGSGDGPMAEASASTTTTVFSSNFEDYCKGRPLDLYFYEILIHHDLLASAATDLPVEAASSSVASGSATSSESITTHMPTKASSRKSIDVDLTGLAESPDSRQSRKRAFDAVAERNSVEVKAAKLSFFSKAQEAVGTQEKLVKGLAEGKEKKKSAKLLRRLERRKAPPPNRQKHETQRPPTANSPHRREISRSRSEAPVVLIQRSAAPEARHPKCSSSRGTSCTHVRDKHRHAVRAQAVDIPASDLHERQTQPRSTCTGG